MKTRILRGWKIGVTLATFPLFLGCFDDSKEANAQAKLTPTGAEPAKTEEVVAADEKVEVPPTPIDLEKISPQIKEVAKLVQSGVSEEVILEYIRKSNLAFNPSAEELVYLTDLGMSESVLKELIKKEGLDPATQPVEQEVAEVTPAPEAITNKVADAPSAVAANAPVPSAVAPALPNHTTTQISEGGDTYITNNYYHDYLEPYGSWVEVADYGYCWRPTVAVVDTSWRPYSHRGRWIWTDVGWYWQSDYSWGWIPFHYGRWHHHSRHGWVWVPGNVWGPAWVSWRYDDGYCGWAPLPPHAHYVSGVGFRYYGRNVGFSFDFGLSDYHYVFVSYDRFCDPHPHRHYVHHHHHHHRDIYRRSHVSNHYRHDRDRHSVVNDGPGYDRVRRNSKSEIKTVSVRDANRSGQPDRVQRSGNSEVVYRQRMPESKESGSASRTRASARRESAAASQASPSTARSSTTGSSTETSNARTTQRQSAGSTTVSSDRNSGTRSTDTKVERERSNRIERADGERERSGRKLAEGSATERPAGAVTQPATPSLNEPTRRTEPRRDSVVQRNQGSVQPTAPVASANTTVAPMVNPTVNQNTAAATPATATPSSRSIVNNPRDARGRSENEGSRRISQPAEAPEKRAERGRSVVAQAENPAAADPSAARPTYLPNRNREAGSNQDRPSPVRRGQGNPGFDGGNQQGVPQAPASPRYQQPQYDSSPAPSYGQNRRFDAPAPSAPRNEYRPAPVAPSAPQYERPQSRGVYERPSESVRESRPERSYNPPPSSGGGGGGGGGGRVGRGGRGKDD